MERKPRCVNIMLCDSVAVIEITDKLALYVIFLIEGFNNFHLMIV